MSIISGCAELHALKAQPRLLQKGLLQASESKRGKKAKGKKDAKKGAKGGKGELEILCHVSLWCGSA